MNLDVVGLVLLPEFFQPFGEVVVINPGPGFGNFFLQRDQDNTGLEIRRHQLPDFTRAFYIESHLVDMGRRTSVIFRDDRTTIQTLLRHPGPTHRGGPHGFHERPIYPRIQEYIVSHLAHDFEVGSIKNGAILGFNGDAKGVTRTGQLRSIFKKIGNVGMTRRDHLLERGIQGQAGGLITQYQRCQQANQNNDQSIVEEDSFNQRP